MGDDGKKKKGSGVLSAIWESMTKTGGCCGPGETCGGSQGDAEESPQKEDTTPPDEVQKEE